MNRNLEKAMFDIGKVDALMAAYENTYLDVTDSDGIERDNQRQFAFYAIWDAVKMVDDDITRLAGDRRVIDVLEAISRER